jgi:hypothetical protein
MGDMTILIASEPFPTKIVLVVLMIVTYYLFRVKSSMLHRQRKLLGKLQTIVLETMYVVPFVDELTIGSRRS